MKIYANDLTKVEWLNEILNNAWSGQKFLGLKSGYYFVFFYNNDESQSIIKFKSIKPLPIINDLLYEDQYKVGASYLGVLKPPYDTNNMLLYQFLRGVIYDYVYNTVSDRNKLEEGLKKYLPLLDELFLSYKNEDLKKISQPNIKGVFDIVIESNLEDALNNFMLEKRVVNSLLDITRACATFVKKITGKNLVGQSIKQIVNAIQNPNGGLIPQEAGSTMRYLIIGEVAAGQDNEKLNEAKNLLRQAMPIENIFLKTGWFFSRLDNKWRKKLSDVDLKFKTQYFKKYDAYEVLNPRNFNSKEIVNVAYGGSLLMSLLREGYDVKIGDIIEDNPLFEYYPKLKDLSLVLAIDSVDKQHNAYYSNSLPKHINIGSAVEFNPLQTLLHEVQHYIQMVEGFANGGNTTLAEIISSVGGSGFRFFANGMDIYTKEFCKAIDERTFKLLEDLKIPQLDVYLLDVKTAQDNCVSIFYLLLNTYLNRKNPIESRQRTRRFVENEISKECYDFFNQVHIQTLEVAKYKEDELKKGLSKDSLEILFYNTYRWLLGEQEARFVQQTQYINQELSDYFQFYSNETFEADKVNVIGVQDLSDSPKNALAAVETLSTGEYIIHLTKTYNAESYLHELGHIIFDCIKNTPDEMTVLTFFREEKHTFKDIEEFFCTAFVEFWLRFKISDVLNTNIFRARKTTNYVLSDKADSFFNKLFFTELVEENKTLLKKYIEFVKLLNDLT